jgi:hypothetical protein
MGNKSRAGLIVVLMLGVVTLACGPLGGGEISSAQQTLEAAATQLAAEATQGGGGAPTTAAEEPTDEGVPATAEEQPTVEGGPTASPTYDAIPAQLTVPPMLTALAATATAAPGSLRQWAIAAQASTQYGDPDWGAVQAVGEPNAYPTCGDNVLAWASAGSNTVDSLELVYQTPVVPVALFIYEVSGPGSIVRIEVVEESGAKQVVYEGMPIASQECPRIFSVGITDVTAKVNRVIVHIDQTVLATWNEIDAVELVGNP